MSGSEKRAWIRGNIKKCGQSLVGVWADMDIGSPAFVYSIGNHASGLPELLLVAGRNTVFSDDVADLLNVLCDLQRKRKDAFTDGETVQLGQRPMVMLQPDENIAKADFTCQAGWYWRHEKYAVIQVVLCDPDGRWPWDQGCAEPFSHQLELTLPSGGRQ